MTRANSESGSQRDFRFPRFKRKGLEGRRFSHLAGEFIERQPLADDATDGHAEAFAICQLAIVVAIGLLVQIAEQMERLDADIGSVDAALEQAPEVFQSVSVDLPVNVLDGVIDDLMRILASKTIVGKQGISVERRTGFDVLSHFRLQGASSCGSGQRRCATLPPRSRCP